MSKNYKSIYENVGDSSALNQSWYAVLESLGIVIGQTGGIGLAPSACIGEDFAFFEPVHGTAWDIAGKGIANPIASILSAKLMLEWLGHGREALAIEGAVSSVLSEGKIRTPDIGGSSHTSEVGDAIAARVEMGTLQQPSDLQTIEAEE